MKVSRYKICVKFNLQIADFYCIPRKDLTKLKSIKVKKKSKGISKVILISVQSLHGSLFIQNVGFHGILGEKHIKRCTGKQNNSSILSFSIALSDSHIYHVVNGYSISEIGS